MTSVHQTPCGNAKLALATPVRWLRSALRYAAATTALLLAVAAPAQVDPGTKAALLRQGFTETDFRHFSTAERPPHNRRLGSWVDCITSTSAPYLANDWSVAKALDAATALCSDKEASLLAGLTTDMGLVPARRVIALTHAIVRTAYEKAAARRKAAPPRAAAPFRPDPPDDDFGGGWTFGRSQDGSCNAALTYEGKPEPSVYVVRARDRYTLVLRQPSVNGQPTQPTDARQVFLFYGERAVEHQLTFKTDNDELDELLVLQLTQAEIAPWRDATLLWVGPRGGEQSTNSTFWWYPLHDLAATLTKLDWCMKP